MDRIRVIDVPHGTHAVEAQRLMNEPCNESAYMLVQVVQLADGTSRAFYRMLSKEISNTVRATSGAAKRDAAQARAALAAILSEHPTMGINRLRYVLKSKGFAKGQLWITYTRAELLAQNTV